MRVVNAGISQTEVCGVRDAAKVLEAALIRRGVETSTIWCNLSHTSSPRQQWAEVRQWLDGTRMRIEAEAPDAVILHYSVFAYGLRGVPVFAPAVSARIASSRVPVVGYLHEFAYPFGRRGWRGTVQATTQRAALVPVVRRCSVLVATTERRVSWLETRLWLARRPTIFVPVHSNLPPVEKPSVPANRDAPSLGVFGFASPDVRPAIVADAVALLRSRGREVTVLLVGAPGESSEAGRRWLDAFGAADCAGALRFTGVIPLEDLARALATVDIFVFPETNGPESRRGTLAAELAAGKTVIAFDGKNRWNLAVTERALVVVEPDAHVLAESIEGFVRDPKRREEQGSRAGGLYERCMSPDVVSEKLAAAIAAIRPPEAPALEVAGIL